jgi:hypothetical protein
MQNPIQNGFRDMAIITLYRRVTRQALTRDAKYTDLQISTADGPNRFYVNTQTESSHRNVAF